MEWSTVIEKRKEELGVLVDEVTALSFVLKALVFGIDAIIDESKLSIIGHQIGAVAAKELAKEDKRVKCVVMMDPFVEDGKPSQ